MNVHVVLDLLGAGRIVGAFDQEADALRVIGGFREYYKAFPAEIPDDAGDAVWIVLETSGGMSIAGVTATEKAAAALAGQNPAYRSAHKVLRNRIDPSVVDWAVSDEQRAHLNKLLR